MRRIFAVCLVLLCFTGGAFAFSNPFKKKYDSDEEKKEPMVQTVEEWLETATDVKMDMRKREEVKEEDDKIIPAKEKPVYIERYNVKAGSKELDLTYIFKNQIIRSNFVSDPDFKNAVYTETYYYPQTSQTASTFYLIELDNNLGKKERLKDVSIFEHTRYPLISTALPYLKQGMFSTLTMVDFSSDGNMILVKEKRGSNKFGLYETYVWIYYLTDELRENNTCYMNNVDFSNEISSFEALDGRVGGIKGGKAGENTDFNKNTAFDFDLNNLKSAPDKALPPLTMEVGGKNIQLKPIEELDPSIKGQGLGQGSGQGEFNSPDLSWLKEGVTNVDKKRPGAEYGFKEENMAHLDYKEVKDFIKATWKADEMTSPYKTRWYNEIPVDFRVDDSYVSGKDNIGFGVRLNLLNEMIKAYWFDRQDLILNHIRWDLNPLGFNSNNKDEIIVTSWAYSKEGEKVSLGNWAVNVKTGIPRLIQDGENISIEANALYLEEKLNPR